jgi:ribosomal-protein-alanine N-acetyltransferase
MDMDKAETTLRPISIIQATWRDLGALRELEKACFPRDAWPLLDLIGVLTFPNVVRLKALHNEHMVGFVAGDNRRSGNISWISTICVSPAYQSQGIGSTLLKACEEQLPMPTIRLSVRASNITAIRLYQQHGYAKVDEWGRYYYDGETAVVMEKVIKKSAIF